MSTGSLILKLMGVSKDRVDSIGNTEECIAKFVYKKSSSVSTVDIEKDNTERNKINKVRNREYNKKEIMSSAVNSRDKTNNKNIGEEQIRAKEDGVINKIKIKLDEMSKKAELEREKVQLIQNWKRIMAHSKRYNSEFNTFEIINETKTSYGWWFQLLAPPGLSFDDLNTLKSTIQHNLGCTFVYNIAESNRIATCKVIYNKLVKCNDILFEPVKVKPYQVYPGVDVTGKPVIIDVNASPHVLIAGQTRKGKNGSVDSIILSWINSCTDKEIQLYLFQCTKVDLIKYQNCGQVKCFVLGDFNKILKALRELVDVEIKNRLELFKDMFKWRKGENIYDYNKLNNRNQLPYIYVVIDEFLELMLKSKYRKEENDVKDEILSYIQRIGQIGAAVGVQYVVVHQKPEMKLCPTFIKNMSSIRICFGFDDESCGRIVLGDRDGSLVVDMPSRRAYVNNNGNLELIYTTNLDNRRDMYIKPHEVINRQDYFDVLRERVVEKEVKMVEKTIDKNIRIIGGLSKVENRPMKNNSVIELKSGVSKTKVRDIEEILESKSIKNKDTQEVGGKIEVELEEIQKDMKIRADNGGNDRNIDKIIEQVAEENSKRIKGWVPYVPVEGDKVPDINEIRLIK